MKRAQALLEIDDARIFAAKLAEALRGASRSAKQIMRRRMPASPSWREIMWRAEDAARALAKALEEKR